MAIDNFPSNYWAAKRLSYGDRSGLNAVKSANQRLDKSEPVDFTEIWRKSKTHLDFPTWAQRIAKIKIQES